MIEINVSGDWTAVDDQLRSTCRELNAAARTDREGQLGHVLTQQAEVIRASLREDFSGIDPDVLRRCLIGGVALYDTLREHATESLGPNEAEGFARAVLLLALYATD